MTSRTKLYEAVLRLQADNLRLRRERDQAHLEAAIERSRISQSARARAEVRRREHALRPVGQAIAGELEAFADAIDQGEHHVEAEVLEQLGLPWRRSA